MIITILDGPNGNPTTRKLTIEGFYEIGNSNKSSIGQSFQFYFGHGVKSFNVPNIPSPPPLEIPPISKCPIVFDLNGNGKADYVDIDDSNVNFDMDGDGIKDRTAWVSATDGIFAYDKDLNGLIESTDEIGFKQNGAPTDLEGLRRDYDTNEDGLLSSEDSEWHKFGLWQDKNQNGITDAGEFRSLEEWGIESIGLVSDLEKEILPGKAYITGRSEYTKTDGTTGVVTDAVLPIVKGTEGGLSEIEIQQKIDLIKQAMATAAGDEGMTPLTPNPNSDEMAPSAFAVANPLST